MKQIFDERGFLSPEGKVFVDEVFKSAVAKVIATAETDNDVQIIGCILKNEVGKMVLDKTTK